MKEDILNLAQEYNINPPKSKMPDFDYLDFILKEVEESVTNCPINNKILELRGKLGSIFYNDEVFSQIYELTMGLKDLFKCPDIILLELPDEWE